MIDEEIPRCPSCYNVVRFEEKHTVCDECGWRVTFPPTATCLDIGGGEYFVSLNGEHLGKFRLDGAVHFGDGLYFDLLKRETDGTDLCGEFGDDDTFEIVCGSAFDYQVFQGMA